MRKLTDLKILFTTVAIVEFCYGILSLMPPSWIEPSTGWVLNADGNWLVKILGMSLLTQGFIAWTYRKEPSVNVARILAFYQVASATVDWVMWIILKDDGIFSTPLSRVTVPAAIVSHYAIGLLLIVAIAAESRTKISPSV